MVRKTKIYEEIQTRREAYRKKLIDADSHDEIIKYSVLLRELSYLEGFILGADEAWIIVEDK